MDKNFFKACINNKYDKAYDKLQVLLKECNDDYNALAEKLISSDDKDILSSPAYAIASKHFAETHNIRVHEMLAKWHKVISDAGSIKVGNSSFSVMIPCGGDGYNCYAVVDIKDDYFNSGMFEFICFVEGSEICIYSYDCGNKIDTRLDKGRYCVYASCGHVIFEKW